MKTIESNNTKIKKMIKDIVNNMKEKGFKCYSVDVYYQRIRVSFSFWKGGLDFEYHDNDGWEIKRDDESKKIDNDESKAIEAFEKIIGEEVVRII